MQDIFSDLDHERVANRLFMYTFFQILEKKSESLQTEGRHFRSMICKLSDV